VNGNTEPSKDFLATGFRDIIVACGVLTGVCLAVWPLFAVVGYAHSGWMGILAALVAAGICWGGAIAGLVITGLLRLTSQPVQGVLLGMFPRLAVPLLACVLFARTGGQLVEAGVLVMVLLYYFVTLTVDTLLLVRIISGHTQGKSISRIS
jgi:hypothetical protein